METQPALGGRHRQVERRSDGVKPPVLGPETRACSQADGGEQMDIDIADPPAEEFIGFYEPQHFQIIRGDGARQSCEIIKDRPARIEVS